MTDLLSPSSPNRLARLAGLLYLMVIAGGICTVSINSALNVLGEAEATAAKIVASEMLFRLGFAADLVSTASYVGVTALLYILFRPTSHAGSFSAAAFGLIGCAVGAANLLNHLAPLILLHSEPALSALAPAQLDALAALFLKLDGSANSVALAFFGVYCLLLGTLIVRSTFFPSFVGVLLGIAGISHLTGSVVTFLLPAVHLPLAIIAVPVLLGEGALCFWLLAKGVNVVRWRLAERATAIGAAEAR